MKGIFCATPQIAVPTLELLCHMLGPHQLTLITQPARPAGRGQKVSLAPIASKASELNIPFRETSNINTDDNCKELIANADFVLVFAFSQFFKKHTLELAKWGAFNIHTSLLPKYRGAAPIQHALMNGDSETGVTLQKMKLKMDAGDIIMQKTCPIDGPSGENTLTLSEKLSILAKDMTWEWIQFFKSKGSPYPSPPIPQLDHEATFAPLLTKDLGKINFQLETAIQIERKTRALTPWPSVNFRLGESTIKIIQAKVHQHLNLLPGQIQTTKDHLFIGCREGALELVILQREGKNPCDAKAFLQGYSGPWTITPNS